MLALLMLVTWVASYGQEVTGTIVDETGEPLIGVYVRDKVNNINAITDGDGKFSVKVPQGGATLTVTYMGMKTIIQKVKAGQKVRWVMQENVKQMKDVVITGYQQLDRRNLTSSVTSVDMKDIEIPGIASVDKMLEGRIPDLVLTNNSGEINATPKLRVRGTSTLIGNREPLWVLDGIILTDPVDLSPDVLNDPDYVNRIGNAIAGINPQDIQRIDVLKDAAATALYGTRAANGVIVVTTKSGREGKPTVNYSAQLTLRKRPYYSDGKINLMNSILESELEKIRTDLLAIINDSVLTEPEKIKRYAMVVMESMNNRYSYHNVLKNRVLESGDKQLMECFSKVHGSLVTWEKEQLTAIIVSGKNKGIFRQEIDASKYVDSLIMMLSSLEFPFFIFNLYDKYKNSFDYMIDEILFKPLENV